MRIYFLNILALTLIFASCDFEKHNHTHLLRKRTVYIISSEESAPQIINTENSDTSYVENVLSGYDLVDIKSLDTSIRVNLRYAGTNNFLKYNLYDGLRNAYFNCETALRICAAQYFLKEKNPELSLVILDASRPQHIQQMMWDSLKMHPDKKLFYLSKPEETSMHNYGCAVDVTLMNVKTGTFLDMGTDFDFFGNLSEPIYEARFLKSGELSREAYENRMLLRTAMMRAKMNPITSEWWHFSLCTKPEAIARFRLIK